MKLNSALIVWAFTAVFVVAAGCTSFGGDTQSPTAVPTAAVQNPGNPGTAGSPTKTTPLVLPTLTDSQKTQAESIAKADNAVKRDILSKPQFKVTDVSAEYSPADGSDVIACVTFEGRDSAHSDANKWLPERYMVFVSIPGNKVTLTKHIEPLSLATPIP